MDEIVISLVQYYVKNPYDFLAVQQTSTFLNQEGKTNPKKSVPLSYHIENSRKTLQKNNNRSLFDTQEILIKTFHLLPEYKTVDYFLKVDSLFSTSKEKYILDRIQKIPQVATAYSVDSSELKSKDNLIFS